jgi:hypothetical protein
MGKRDINCYAQREQFREIVKASRTPPRRPLAHATIENYTTLLMSCMRHCGLSDPEALGSSPQLTNEEAMQSMLAKYSSVHRKKQCLDVLISIYPHLQTDKYNDQRLELNATIQHTANQNLHSGVWIPWEAIMAIPNPLHGGGHEGHMRAICLELYRQLPPLRRDWDQVYILNNAEVKGWEKANSTFKDTVNHIDLDLPHPVITLNVLSKIKREEPLVIHLLDYPELYNILTDSFAKYPRTHLLHTAGHPNMEGHGRTHLWTKQDITSALKSFGLSVPLLRKSYVTHMNKSNPTMEDRIRIANMMNHSPMTSLVHYNKPNA